MIVLIPFVITAVFSFNFAFFDTKTPLHPMSLQTSFSVAVHGNSTKKNKFFPQNCSTEPLIHNSKYSYGEKCVLPLLPVQIVSCQLFLNFQSTQKLAANDIFFNKLDWKRFFRTALS